MKEQPQTTSQDTEINSKKSIKKAVYAIGISTFLIAFIAITINNCGSTSSSTQKQTAQSANNEIPKKSKKDSIIELQKKELEELKVQISSSDIEKFERLDYCYNKIDSLTQQIKRLSLYRKKLMNERDSLKTELDNEYPDLIKNFKE